MVGAVSSGPYGQGCGPGGLADLEVAGEPVLGAVLDVRVGDVAALAPAGLYLSLAPAAMPLGECTLYLAAPQLALAVGMTYATGAWSLSLGLPPEPVLARLELYLQAAARTGPGLSDLGLTNGV